VKNLLITGVVLLGLSTTINAGLTDVKDIRVVSSESNTDMYYEGTRGSLFSFVRPTKSDVEVGEYIRVSLKLKRKAYLYLIAVSNRSNKAYLILPNEKEGYNKYRAGVHYVMPRTKGEFHYVSDSPGQETIYVIASTYKQNFEQLLNRFGDKEGQYRTSTAKSAHSFMKDILVVPARRYNAKVEIRKLNINIY